MYAFQQAIPNGLTFSASSICWKKKVGMSSSNASGDIVYSWLTCCSFGQPLWKNVLQTLRIHGQNTGADNDSPFMYQPWSQSVAQILCLLSTTHLVLYHFSFFLVCFRCGFFCCFLLLFFFWGDMVWGEQLSLVWPCLCCYDLIRG